MRNSHNAWKLIAVLATLPTVAALTGCAADKKGKAELNEGYAAFENRNYDEAVARADSYLHRSPAGRDSAEALYLRGRALEQKTYSSNPDAIAGWQAARAAYAEALGRSPSQKLQTLIHMGLANVAYHQDDYATAEREWTIVHDKLEDENLKASVLYRIGRCRQRTGRFADADAVFKAIQERYPNSVQAQRAREIQGARGFSVRLATFTGASTADTALNTLRREGVLATRQTDQKGRSVILVGPMPTYQQAASMKARYAGTYPDAIVLP
jgi:tetratricopeptide (TPR) repeat protein